MRHAPVWSQFEAIAPTLVYDATPTGGEDRSAPIKRAATVIVPTLVMKCTVIPLTLPTANELAKAIPQAHERTLEGQPHDVNPQVLAPILIEFFTS